MVAGELVGGILSKYWSSKDDGTNESNLSAYTTACEEDPELKSFGSSLDQRFSKLKGSLSPGGNTDNSSLNVVKPVCVFLVEMNQDLAERIIANKDLFKVEELRSLVELYYESSSKTLDLLNTVENCANKAKLSFLEIRLAIEEFEKESSMDTDFEGKKKKYAETLEELNKVKAMGDPFGDEYKNKLKSVREEQLICLDKFHELVVKLEKEKEEYERTRNMSTIVFVSASLALMAVEICVRKYLPAFQPLPVVHYVADVARKVNYVVGAVGLLVDKIMEVRENVLDRKKEVVNNMEDSTKVYIHGTDTITSLVEKLITSLSLILRSVELVVVKREEDAVKLVMEEVRSEVDAFATTVKELGDAVATCSTSVSSTKLQVLEHITISMSSSSYGKKK